MDYAAPEGTLHVLEALFYLCACGLCLAGMIRLLKGKTPEPPNQQLQATIDGLAAGLQAVKNDNAHIWQVIDSNWKSAEAANEKRAHDIHVRLNPAAEDIAAVKGQMAAFTASFENFARMIVSLAQNKKL